MTDAYPRSPITSAHRQDHFPQGVLRRAFQTNATTTSFAGLLPTATEPVLTTAGVHKLGKCNAIMIMPYGTDGRSEEFRLWVSLWHPLYDYEPVVKSSETVAWIPQIIAALDCTMHDSAIAAAQAGPIATTDMWCTLIAAAGGTTHHYLGTGKSTSYVGGLPDFVTSAGDGAGTTSGAAVSVSLLTLGAKYVQFSVDVNGGAGTAADSGNCAFAEI
jgi:hypothetical protein